MWDVQDCASSAMHTNLRHGMGFMAASGMSTPAGDGAKEDETAAIGNRDAGQSNLEQGQALADTGCQERVDTKAFTGRGDLHELRQLEREVDRLELLMDKLVTLSKDVVGAPMYLAKHRRKSTGYVFLRWREAGGRKRHLSWEQARQNWSQYDRVTRGWYAQLSAEVRQVNEQHVAARRRMRSVLRQVQKKERHVYARPIADK